MGAPTPPGIAEDDAVRTSEQAQAYARQQVVKLAQAVCEAQATALATEQRRLYHVALLRYGCALGTFSTLRVTGLLDDVAYELLRQEAVALMQPQLVAR